MARLTLQLEGSPSKEFGIGSSITIGRLPDNAIVIDNPAVSSHHACVFRDGESFVLEDLQSTNGTFVDGKRISRSRLKDDDVIVIGNEKLTFNERLTGSVTEAPAATTDEITTQTVFVDADNYQRLMTIVMNAEARSADGAAPGPLGLLRVLHGNTDRPEYLLESHTSVIGKAEWSLVRLKGWLTPNVSLAITRNRLGYVATRLGGKVAINGQPISRHDLKDGDVMSVGGLTLEFCVADAAAASVRSGDPAAA